MRRMAGLLVLITVLLTACAGRPGAPAPAPATTAPSEPTPAQPAPLPPAATQPPPAASPTPPPPVPLPKLELAQVSAVELWTPGQAHGQVMVHPQENPDLVQAVLTALGGAGEGRLRNDNPDVRLTAVVRLRSDETLTLSLRAAGGTVAAGWQQRSLAIDSPALTRALEALEPELAKAQPLGTTRLWAIAPTGRKAPELLLAQERFLMLEGVSPDGRYVLLAQQLGLYKGDYTAIPYLWDRTTGQLTEGSKASIRYGMWSGNGFYIDGLTHLDLQLHETQDDALTKALALKAETRALIAFALSADGKRFAALVGHPQQEEPLDLVQGNRDGTGLSIIPKAATGPSTQIGIIAYLALSPDGQYLALTDKDGAAIGRSAETDPQRWKRLPGIGGDISWAPDGKHLGFALGGIFDRAGELFMNPGPGHTPIWQPDGQGCLIFNAHHTVFLRLDHTATDVKTPDWAIPAGYLPDGRFLAWRSVYKPE